MGNHHYNRKDRVLVRTSAGARFESGHIDRLEGKGAFVKKDSGHVDFYFWNQIKPAPEAAKEQPQPRATIGDIMPQAVLERVAAGSVKASPVVPVAPPPAPPPGRVPDDASVEDEPPPTPRAQKVPPSFGAKGVPRILRPRERARPRTPTRIGDAMKAIRLERGKTQESMAESMPCGKSRLINIETGDALPDRVEVERFAAAIKSSPDPLLGLLALDQEDRAELRKRAAEERSKPKPIPKTKLKGERAPKAKKKAPEKTPGPEAPSEAAPAGFRFKIHGVYIETDNAAEAAELIKKLGQTE